MGDDGTYRAIYVRLLDDPDYRALTPNARHALLAVKMLLPYWGLAKLYEAEVADVTGYSNEFVRGAMNELLERGWIEREGCWVWLKNGLRFEPKVTLTNENHVIGIRRALRDIPKIPILGRFLAHYPELQDGSFHAPSRSHPPSHPPSPRDTMGDPGSSLQEAGIQEAGRTDTSKSKSVISTRAFSQDGDELSRNDTPAPVGAAAPGTGEGTQATAAVEPRAKDPGGESGTGAIVKRLYGIWLEGFGGNPPLPKLTDKRRQVLKALWTEQLRARDGPDELFRAVCRAVKQSDHHMSQRAYQMPESLFRNPERRDRWVNIAANGSGLERLSAADRKFLQRRLDMERIDLGAPP